MASHRLMSRQGQMMALPDSLSLSQTPVTGQVVDKVCHHDFCRETVCGPSGKFDCGLDSH